MTPADGRQCGAQEARALRFLSAAAPPAAAARMVSLLGAFHFKVGCDSSHRLLPAVMTACWHQCCLHLQSNIHMVYGRSLPPPRY